MLPAEIEIKPTDRVTGRTITETLNARHQLQRNDVPIATVSRIGLWSGLITKSAWFCGEKGFCLDKAP